MNESIPVAPVIQQPPESPVSKITEFLMSAVLTLTFIGIVVTIGWIFLNRYPTGQKQVEAVVPINQHIYYPGDRVGFRIRKCDGSWEFKEVSFQLETDERQQPFAFITLENKNDLSYPYTGCVEVTDWTQKIPEDIFEKTDMEPGRFRFFIWTQPLQNFFQEPVVYRTDWFEIRRADEQ